MSVVFSLVGTRCIVMSAGSSYVPAAMRVRGEATVSRAFLYEGVGCVTVWGAVEGNGIGAFLREQDVEPGKWDIERLADAVQRYLVGELRPCDSGIGEVGYHVGGFGSDGLPVLTCVHWGYEHHDAVPDNRPDYRQTVHSPHDGQRVLLYDGRNDLVFAVIAAFLAQLQTKMPVRYDMDTVAGSICLSDFVCRFAAEVTPEVAPPLETRVLWPNRVCMAITNPELEAPRPDVLSESIDAQGLDVRSYY